MRVVLDTNVLVSELVIARGPTARLREFWLARRFAPLGSTATVQELVRVLGCPKFKLEDAARDELLADCLPYLEVVRVPDPPPKVPACRDKFDLPFLHLAVTGRAAVLVSGDADLLALGRVGRRIIEAPHTFLERLGD